MSELNQGDMSKWSANQIFKNPELIASGSNFRNEAPEAGSDRTIQQWRQTMTYTSFVKKTICNLSESMFEELKQLLLGEYISFSIIDHKDVTINILAEKVCDYFSMLEIKTGKAFDKHIETYLSDLDSIVSPHIAKTPQAKKGDKALVAVPRSRRYYEKAITVKGVKKPSLPQLLDYSRIMMCLYAAAIKNEGKPIDNFDYASECLALASIVDAMKNEEVSVVFPPSKELYSDDVCTLILSILFLCSIISGKVEGETDHE